MSDQLIEIFEKLNWKFKTYSKGYLVSCPNQTAHRSGGDNHPSCNIWPNIGRFKCYACGYAGKLRELFASVGFEYIHFELNTFEKDENPVLDEDILSFPKAEIEHLDSPAFEKRNWDERRIVDHDLRYDPVHRNIVYPVRCGGLIGAVGRSTKGKVIHNYFGFLTGQSLGGYDGLSSCRRLAIVEGWTCLVNCYEWAKELDYDVVCTFTANFTKEHAELACDTGKVIHFWYDQDKAGHKGVKNAEQYIGDTFFRKTWEPSLGDVGAMSRETFFSIFD